MHSGMARSTVRIQNISGRNIHSYEDLPRVLNPPAGFVQNCNDAPWVCTYPPVLDPDSFPSYMAPLGTYWRAQRAINMIKDNPSISFDQLVDISLIQKWRWQIAFLDDLLSAVEQFPGPEALEAAARCLKPGTGKLITTAGEPCFLQHGGMRSEEICLKNSGTG